MLKPISIIIPSYKKSELLKNTLTSLMGQIEQSNYDDEVLVIDDGLHDYNIIEQFDVYHLMRPHEKRYQLSSNNNYGLKLASNPYIAKIDADCIPLENWLEEMRNEINENTLCLGRVQWRREEGDIREDSRFNDNHKYCNGFNKAPQQAWGGNMGATKEVLLSLDGWTEEYDGHWGSEESDLGWKFYYYGKNIKFCYDPVVLHQYHQNGDYRTTAGQNKNYDLLKEKKEQYKKNGGGSGKILRS